MPLLDYLSARPILCDAEEEVEKITVEEVLRLAVMVDIIDSEAAMAPNGALVLSGTGTVVANPSFSGADKVTAMSASGYVFVNKTKANDALATTAKKVLTAPP